MNRNLAITLVVGGLVALGVAGYVLSRQGQDQSVESTSEAMRQDGTSQTAQTIQNALAGDGSVVCTFEDEEGNDSTAYIKNGMARFDSFATSTSQNSHMIFSNDIVYVWEEESSEGFMFDVSDAEEQAEEMSRQYNVVQDADDIREEIEQNNYSCTTQSVSDDMFVPPTDVEFVDFQSALGEQMQDVQEQMEQYQSDGSIPEEYQNLVPEEYR